MPGYCDISLPTKAVALIIDHPEVFHRATSTLFFNASKLSLHTPIKWFPAGKQTLKCIQSNHAWGTTPSQKMKIFALCRRWTPTVLSPPQVLCIYSRSVVEHVSGEMLFHLWSTFQWQGLGEISIMKYSWAVVRAPGSELSIVDYINFSHLSLASKL